MAKSRPTAVVYCEANFGAIDGKTANGLVRHSERYDIVSVIDSEQAGLDTGTVLDDVPNGVPIVRDLAQAIASAGTVPDYFILGLAPASGMLSQAERGLVLRSIGLGMNVVNGLHEFLSDDPEFAAASAAKQVEILDVRKPRAKKDLRIFSGRIDEVTCPRIAVLGTDCAIGKRTTATILTRELNRCGVKAVMVGTGQTGLMQGARYGISLDAIPGGPKLGIVSGGNSGNLEWALGADDVGRINNLRLGESLLLGRETLYRAPIEGLHTDAITLVAEVIESKVKPTQPWGALAQNACGDQPPATMPGRISQTILAIGRQDTDPDGLEPPPGIKILAASSDHLIADAGRGRLSVGSEVMFQLNYSALVRAMTSPFVDKVLKVQNAEMPAVASYAVPLDEWAVAQEMNG